MQESTDPYCPVCDAELVEETRTRRTWTAVVSGIRGGRTETEKSGWELVREFDCGGVAKNPAGEEHWLIEVQCQKAHEIALRLKRRVAELEAGRAAEPGDRAG